MTVGPASSSAQSSTPAMSGTPVTTIILAAGEGTRMRSRQAKVLHEIGGRSLLAHAVDAVAQLRPQRLVVVIGHQAEQVGPHALTLDPHLEVATQHERGGTGHAVRVALEAVKGHSPTVMVTYGDVPLLQTDTLRQLLEQHAIGGHVATLLTAQLPDPSGYGRIVRDAEGAITEIVEQHDANAAQLSICEVNSGIFAFDADFLRQALAQLSTDNAQGELYLTDVVGIARRVGAGVGAVLLADRWQTEGVNDREQLARLGAEFNRRTVIGWMRRGVTIVDPPSTWIDWGVVLDADVTLLPGVQLHGATTVEHGAVVGPDTTLTDVSVGSGATITRTHGREAVVGDDAVVGPFAYLRPGTRLGRTAKIGAFVEAKNADLGPGAKVPHLSYVGDATVGEGTNIGAGTIFANFDGVAKHHTVVGRHCRTGSDNVFVAPVEIGDGAVTGAGTVVRRDVPPGALAVSSGPQRHIERWVARKRPGSPGADAAAAAAREPADGGQSGSVGQTGETATEGTHP